MNTEETKSKYDSLGNIAQIIEERDKLIAKREDYYQIVSILNRIIDNLSVCNGEVENTLNSTSSGIVTNEENFNLNTQNIEAIKSNFSNNIDVLRGNLDNISADINDLSERIVTLNNQVIGAFNVN